MRYLLDTHAFLWWVLDDPRLSPAVRAIVQDPGNDIYFSAASAWEIAIKHQLGRMEFSENPDRFEQIQSPQANALDRFDRLFKRETNRGLSS